MANKSDCLSPTLLALVLVIILLRPVKEIHADVGTDLRGSFGAGGFNAPLYYSNIRLRNELMCYVCSHVEDQPDTDSCVEPSRKKTPNGYCSIYTYKGGPRREDFKDQTHVCQKVVYEQEGKRTLNRTCALIQKYEEFFACPIKVPDDSPLLTEHLGLSNVTNFEDCYCWYNHCNGEPAYKISARSILERGRGIRHLLSTAAVLSSLVFSLHRY